MFPQHPTDMSLPHLQHCTHPHTENVQVCPRVKVRLNLVCYSFSYLRWSFEIANRASVNDVGQLGPLLQYLLFSYPPPLTSATGPLPTPLNSDLMYTVLLAVHSYIHMLFTCHTLGPSHPPCEAATGHTPVLCQPHPLQMQRHPSAQEQGELNSLYQYMTKMN